MKKSLSFGSTIPGIGTVFGGAIGTFYGAKQGAIWASITAFFLY